MASVLSNFSPKTGVGTAFQGRIIFQDKVAKMTDPWFVALFMRYKTKARSKSRYKKHGRRKDEDGQRNVLLVKPLAHGQNWGKSKATTP